MKEFLFVVGDHQPVQRPESNEVAPPGRSWHDVTSIPTRRPTVSRCRFRHVPDPVRFIPVMLLLVTFMLITDAASTGTPPSMLTRTYMKALQNGVTPTRFVEFARRLAEQKGYRNGTTITHLKPGDRYYFIHRGRSMVLVHVGRRPLSAGLRIAVGHIDAPHIHLKARPIYSKEGFILLQTRYYGGIKNYQWVSLPLALVGDVYTRDGRHRAIELGFKPGDPVLVIPDLAPHVDRPYRSRTAREVIKGEELDPIIALQSANGQENPVIQWLQSRYGLTPEDLVSADLDLVPALTPRFVGVDQSLIGAYGQDDRSGGFASLEGLLELTETPEYTAVAILVDLEEVGSSHNTGARSRFYTDLFRALLYRQNPNADENELARMLRRSFVLSVDATTGIHPQFPGVQEPRNAARLGHGVVVKLYGEGFNAHPDVIAWVRRILDDHRIPWQTHMYKVDVGGGGTVGRFFAQRDMEVIDIGVPLLGMHSTFEISSVADVEATIRFIRAFYREPSIPKIPSALP